MSDLCVVLCTCPNIEIAKTVAHEAVKSGLAACVNIIPNVVSVYWWDDAVQEDSECQMVLKTQKISEPELREIVLSKHPYDTPEWLVLDVDDASINYADWIRSTIK